MDKLITPPIIDLTKHMHEYSDDILLHRFSEIKEYRKYLLELQLRIEGRIKTRIEKSGSNKLFFLDEDNIKKVAKIETRKLPSKEVEYLTIK
jgi:hypothetical protein